MDEKPKKRGRGKAKKTVALVQAAAQIAEETAPITVRGIGYKLFAMGLIPSMSKNEMTKLSKKLVAAREEGIIAWNWIVDLVRKPEAVPTWIDPKHAWYSAAETYRKDYWHHQPHWIEVWSEKATVRSVLAPVLNEFAITFRVNIGFNSASAVHSVAELTQTNKKPLTAFYVGDWDPSGLYMSEMDLPGRMTRYKGSMNLVRIALIKSDLTDELPSFSATDKSGDPRYKWFTSNHGHQCWELDAMLPTILRDRVRDHIKGIIDQPAWDRCIATEKVERESMDRFLKKYAKQNWDTKRPLISLNWGSPE